MKNIIFDFDSTVIKGESLEILLEPLLTANPEKLVEIEKITNMGMAGELDFKTSLQRRLAIAQPTKQAIDDFVATNCPSVFTDGMVELIAKLHREGHNVWIFSGGLADSIRPFAKYLNIPSENVYAVEIKWDNDGQFIELDMDNGAVNSKVVAFGKVKEKFVNCENVIVGDWFYRLSTF